MSFGLRLSRRRQLLANRSEAALHAAEDVIAAPGDGARAVVEADHSAGPVLDFAPFPGDPEFLLRQARDRTEIGGLGADPSRPHWLAATPQALDSLQVQHGADRMGGEPDQGAATGVAPDARVGRVGAAVALAPAHFEQHAVGLFQQRRAGN